MTQQLFLSFLFFCLVMAFTPGPNNIMALESGASFGFRRSLPHLFGMGAGYWSLIVVVDLALRIVREGGGAAMFDALKIACLIYMLYLAWRVATAPADMALAGARRPITFAESMAFQWINPKAWAIVVTGVTTYAHRGAHWDLVLAVVFTVSCVGLVAVWTGCGMALRGWLADPFRRRCFNLAMAGMLLVSLWPMLRGVG